ncbi:MAG: IS5 family transposase [Cytophagaceae bacterium]|nr:MAG: IS5 family transposase [Cytophagaceae bacterium]
MGDARFDGRAGASTCRRPKKSDPETECLGRSRGGIGTKIHACTEALGNAVRLIATPGQAGDSPQTLPLLKDLQPGKVLADTAYDSDENRAYCTQNGIEAVIPNRPNRLEPTPLDEDMYRDRNKIERFFGRLKQYRRLATRYDKTVISFLAFWHIGAMLDWLR